MDPLLHQDEVGRIIARESGHTRQEGGVRLDFKDLMRVRVNNILLVSSLYDYYTVVEDGQLTEALFNEYSELNLHYAPHITRVSSGEEALRLMESRDFDLVLSMLRLGDMDLASFCATMKHAHPDIPLFLLSFQSAEFDLFLKSADTARFDNVFIWAGDRTLFLAIIKLYEDVRNAPVDCLEFGVRSIMLVEDSPWFYSSYLPLIYAELITQVQALIEEGRNFADKLLRQRARPKILLARNYEEASQLLRRYGETMLGVISDLSFERGGATDPRAGLLLAREARGVNPELPILIQSSSIDLRQEIEHEGLAFVDKGSRVLLQELSDFMTRNFGFGDFVFRLPDGTEVSRARSIREMRERLRYIPGPSLEYHAQRDHFSNWLRARTRFQLADKLKPVKVSAFADLEELRSYLLSAITEHLVQDQKGVIQDFSRNDYDLEHTFVRIGSGSLGGKGRGLAFTDNLLRKYLSKDFFPDLRISIPRTIVLGTDVFSQFVEQNHLLDLAVQNLPDSEILRAFLHADLPPTVLGDVRAILEKARFPLAVRSSSLLEDAMYQPFAGIYATVMIPNSSHDPSVRFHNLTQAIKYVYASTYFKAARNYIEATANRIEEERMAVVIQEIAGDRHGRYFYPHVSGVARSFNYYPFGKAKQKDGVVNLALGLGKTIVDGGTSLQYSPAYPAVYPQFGTTKDLFNNSQLKFFALDLESDVVRKYPREDQNLVLLGLADAEAHGTLEHIASTYSGQDDRLYEGISRSGPRVITFAPILKSNILPLNEAVRLLVSMCETAVNCPVEIEFAVRLGAGAAAPAEFSFLQLRPMVKQEGGVTVDLGAIPREALLFRSEQALGNGSTRLRHIIYVKPESFDAMRTRAMVREISAMNQVLLRARTPYLLIGPGRWGSSDPSLGIPVGFSDISSAGAIAETSLPNMIIDPSQGSHFFQNLTSFRISYFTLRHYNEQHSIDWEWLEALELVEETPHCRHVLAPEDIEIIVNGQTGEGGAVKRVWSKPGNGATAADDLSLMIS
ncbi:MAG TPA: PEP/pyruvate-binding domain-containing protein [Bacteroidota bacterium]|nr:PEP/pyruvate-binding domain-containing protein [Bacteroidota bacterium]